jgi:hypothetical protein
MDFTCNGNRTCLFTNLASFSPCASLGKDARTLPFRHITARLQEEESGVSRREEAHDVPCRLIEIEAAD